MTFFEKVAKILPLQVVTTAFLTILINLCLTMRDTIFWEELWTQNMSSHQKGGSVWEIFWGHQSTQSHHWLTWQSQIQGVIMQRYEIFPRQMHNCLNVYLISILPDPSLRDLSWRGHQRGSNRNHRLQPQAFENCPNKHFRTKGRGISKQRNWSPITHSKQNLLYRSVSIFLIGAVPFFSFSRMYTIPRFTLMS